MWAPKYGEEEAGRVLLPHVIDDLSHDEPNRILYEFPREINDVQEFQSVSAAAYANAINRASWFLENSLGKGLNFDTLGYIGPGDLRYLILTIAAIKAGYKMLFTSPRNSLEGDIAVIKGANCETWLVPDKGSNIHRVLGEHPLKTLALPDLEYFLNSEAVPHYEYNKTWDEAQHDPCWVLHTSGSTGHPKPIVRSLASTSCFGANILCQPVDGRPSIMKVYFGSRVYITFPLFHAAGLNNSLLWPIFYGCTMILGPELPVTIDIMKDVVKYGKPNGIFAAPSLVESISLDEEFLEMLQNINAIAYAGGPLSQQAGDIVSKWTKVILSMGTTESGWHISVELDQEDWNNIRFHPNTGFDLQAVSEGLYELVAIRQPKLERWQVIFETFPDEQEYHFKDLFSKHPTKKDLWHYQGRIDDIIVLSNGEKFNPTNMEILISGHPVVDSLLIAGQGRFQTSLVVEPVRNGVNSTKTDQQIIDELWSKIEEANRGAPSHAKLFKSHVLISSPDKPFLRASKGTVRRRPTLQLYEHDLDRLYARSDIDQDLGNVKPLNTTNEHELRNDVRQLIKSVTEVGDLGDEDDFFTAGVDSLQVLTIHRLLRRGIILNDSRNVEIKTSIIYENSTINLLSHAIWLLTTNVQKESQSSTENRRVLAMQELVNNYTSHLPEQLPVSSHQSVKRKYLFILTGSTGSLGSYLLDTLIKSSNVNEIWCLNRSENSEKRQEISNTRRGLTTDWETSNVHFRQADLSKPNLGLATKDYQYLLERATNVIHAQWQVDFNLSLPSFSKHIHGVRNLADFVLATSTNHHEVSILFTSSVAVASNWKLSPTVPEKMISDLSAARAGYGESKLVAEHVLWEAAKRSGVNVTICRVGQIAGPVNSSAGRGMWNRKEWLPSIIDASAHLSMVPQTLGKNNVIDWIPVDYLATIILQLANGTNLERGQVFHTVNPSRTTWESLLPVVLARLNDANKGSEIKTVPWTEWVEALAESTTKSPERDLSASKLIEFFVALSDQVGTVMPEVRPVFETTSTAAKSDILKKMRGVNRDWMETWLSQWGF